MSSLIQPLTKLILPQGNSPLPQRNTPLTQRNTPVPLRNAPKMSKKRRRKKFNDKPKTRYFISSVDKQVLYKDISAQFVDWASWQKRILLCRCTERSSCVLLSTFATVLEPIFHRDFEVMSKGGFQSSLIKNFPATPDTASIGENTSVRPVSEHGHDSQTDSPKNKWHLAPVLTVGERKERVPSFIGSTNKEGVIISSPQTTISKQKSPFDDISIHFSGTSINKTNHTHTVHRTTDSLATIDFLKDPKTSMKPQLGSLVRPSTDKQANRTVTLKQYKHEKWWLPPITTSKHYRKISKADLLQSYKIVIDDFIDMFSSWNNAEKGDFLLNIVDLCSPDEVTFFASCISQRLKVINDINRLPDKVQLKIFSYLDPYILCQTSQVCRRWNMLSSHTFLWKNQCYKLATEYSQLDVLKYLESTTTPTGLNWKQIYEELQQSVDQLVTPPDHDESTLSNSYSVYEETIYGEDFSDNENESSENSSKNEYSLHSDDMGLSNKETFLQNSNIFEENVVTEKQEGDVLDEISASKDVVTSDKAESLSEDKPEETDVALDVRTKLVQAKNQMGQKESGDFAQITIGGVQSLKRVRKLQGHIEAVMCVQFDGKRVMTGSADRTVRLWDIRSGRNFHKLKGHQGGVRCLQFDEKYIVTGSWDTSVMIWDVVRFTLLFMITEHTDCVSCLQMNSDILVTGSHDKSVYVFERHTWKLIATLNGHTAAVTCLLLLSNQKVLTGSYDKTLLLWSIDDCEVLRKFEESCSPIMSVKSCGNLIAGGNLDGTVIFWDFFSNKVEGVIKAHDGAIHAICFVGNRFITGGGDKLVKEWDLATCTCLRSLTGHKGTIFSIRASAKRIISGSADGTTRIWDFVCSLQQIGGPYDEMNKIIIQSKVLDEKQLKKMEKKEKRAGVLKN